MAFLEIYLFCIKYDISKKNLGDLSNTVLPHLKKRVIFSPFTFYSWITYPGDIIIKNKDDNIHSSEALLPFVAWPTGKIFVE